MLSDIEALAANGHFAEALIHVRRVLAQDPDSLEARSLAARLCWATQDFDAALAHALHVCERAPERAHAWYVLGRVRRAMGQVSLAISAFERAVALEPAGVDFHVSLGVALRAGGRTQDAISSYQTALKLDPANLAARQNLANALADSPALALAPAPTAGTAATPEMLQRWMRQALEHHQAGDYAAALRDGQMALGVAPADPGALNLSAAAATRMHQSELAVGLYTRLAAGTIDTGASKRGLLDAFRFATTASRRDDAQRYAAAYRGLDAESGTAAVLQEAAALVLPAVNASRAAIGEARAAYERALDTLLARELRLPEDFNLAVIPSFFLAYHGECDRHLMVKAAQFWRTAIPSLKHVAAHCRQVRRRPGRIRIGLISAFLCDHSIGKTTEGLLPNFDRSRFEVYVLRLGPGRTDETSRRIQAAADHYQEIPLEVFGGASAEKIAALELDVLFYQDIGMEPSSYFLAHARLAPVQCVSFGHPNTTGIPSMDYFVSNDLYETEDSPGHYSEQLFLLNNLPTLAYYRRPVVSGLQRPRLESRRALGLPESGALYLCPQTLFKFHPDFDAMLQGILEKDPTGHIVLIRGENLHWYGELMARIEDRLASAARRVISLSALPREGFLDLLASGDVMLDTLHFNGMNSSLEAFSVGLPIVTLPTALQRGRHTQAMYGKMQITEGIAATPDEYVDIAVRLGTDRDFNAHVRAAICERRDVLFEDIAVVREFERFFCEALVQKGVVI